ncbi:MAG: winged helix-turn-helix domain-containing protein [Halanaerobiales bacterium]
MKPKMRIWIENNKGEMIIGEGLLELLDNINKTGSLKEASSEMNMSYRTAWGKINKVEKRLDIKLINSRTGGWGAGGSTLTEEGKSFMKKFSKLKSKQEEVLKKNFNEIFKD